MSIQPLLPFISLLLFFIFFVCVMCYLGLCNAVNDGLQCLVLVTLEDTFHTAGSGGNGLPHRHVQIVVVFLGCKVLNYVKREKILVFELHTSHYLVFIRPTRSQDNSNNTIFMHENSKGLRKLQ